MILLSLVAIGSFILGHIFGERIIAGVYVAAMKILWKLGLYSPPQ